MVGMGPLEFLVIKVALTDPLWTSAYALLTVEGFRLEQPGYLLRAHAAC